MADATPLTAISDSVTSVDIDWIKICPQDSVVVYTLAYNYASGRRVVQSPVTVKTTDFAAVRSARRRRRRSS